MTWLLNGLRLENNEAVALSSDGKMRALRIGRADLCHNGELNAICGDATLSAAIKVVPISFDVPPKDASIRQGEIATYSCTTNKAGVKVCVPKLLRCIMVVKCP